MWKVKNLLPSDDVKISYKEEDQDYIDENIQDEQKEQKDWNDKLDLLKHVTHVHSRIQDQITSDFTLAKLDTKDKEAIIEMVSNAYFSKRLIWMLKERARKYTYDKEKQTWYKKPLDQKQKDRMTMIEDKLFDAYMTRIYMTVILNRNTKENWLMRLITGQSEEHPQQQGLPIEEQTFKDKVKRWLQPKDQQEMIE